MSLSRSIVLRKSSIFMALSGAVASIIAGIFTLFIEPSKPGYLLISSTPSESKICVNDNYVGVTPFEAKLKPGLYKITLSKPGYEKSEQLVKLSSRESKPISFPLLSMTTKTDIDKFKLQLDTL